MNDSSLPPNSEEPPEEVKQGWLTSVHEQLSIREERCKAIARYANDMLLDCDWQFVNKHLKWFELWHIGLIATGTLINRTGVKRKGHDISDWS